MVDRGVSAQRRMAKTRNGNLLLLPISTRDLRLGSPPPRQTLEECRELIEERFVLSLVFDNDPFLRMLACSLLSISGYYCSSLFRSAIVKREWHLSAL